MRNALGALLLTAMLLVAGCGGESRESSPPPEPDPPAEPAPTTPAPEPDPDPAPEPQPEPDPQPDPEPQPAPEPEAGPEPTIPPPPTKGFSWQAGGAFVWHETDVSPEALGRELLEAGFGWVAVYLHDGVSEDPVDGDWVHRFRLASGLPVGGWGALRSAPVEEAGLAHVLLERYGLDFYIANAEAEYVYSGPEGPSAERYARSRAFVDAFRALRPGFPAGLSSYCRPSRHDIDWKAWNGGSFAFLPQAYVNDFGPEATPALCADSLAGFFPRSRVHPTIGMYPGAASSLRVERYARLLARAGTSGFSVYLAETRMTGDEWRVLGHAIASHGIAKLPAAS